jgi:phosphotransferase system, enzyme I, PtsP
MARIHARGDVRLDAVLDFVTFAAKPMPLVSLLDEAPRRLAEIVRADVCSLYLLEGDGETLVMRGNVGFTERALGQVRLKVGEGITGTSVETLRPVSVIAAAAHDSYRHFPELGEERYPVFAAVPIVGRRGALGATVVQRRMGEPFTDADVELLTALSATIAAGVRAAELIDSTRDKHALPRKTGGGTRKVVLPGRPVIPGRALGALAALKRPPSRPREDRRLDDVSRLKGAFDVADKALRALLKRATRRHMGDASFLDTYVQIVNDARLRSETVRLVEEGMGIAEALSKIARRVTRAAVTEKSSFLEERSRDIEDLCDALVMIATGDPRALLPSKAVLVGDQLTVFDVLISARSRPAGIAISDRGVGPRTETLLSLLDIPAVVDVGGLFRWATDGDIALLDGTHGLLILNPSKAEVAALREDRRTKRAILDE